MIKYRKATISDLDKIMTIIEDGRAFLKSQNSGQWQDGDPSRENILQTIKDGHFYVVLSLKGDIASVCALTYQEEDYEHPYEGGWLTHQPYMVMHRCSVKEKYRRQGYGNALFMVLEIEAKKQGYHSIRIDTHEKNVPMRNLIIKNGFTYCGKTILKPNKDRMIFEKII